MKSEATMSSISHDSSRYMNHICHCGIESPLVTSWSVRNPERRFFGCSNYGFDPPMQPEAIGTTSIILGMLRKFDRIEREKEREKERAMEREREKEREMQREREMERAREREREREMQREKEREMQREREMERARERARNDTWGTLLFILIVVVGFVIMKV